MDQELPEAAQSAEVEEILSESVASVPAPRPARKSRSSRRREGGDSGESILNWYLNEIHKIPMLSREQELDVARRARDGEQSARDLLVRSNLRFVVTVARRYQSSGLTMMDLINEGNLGLIKAAEKFNPDRGFHFISYAVWWIKQSILFAIQQKAHLIRLPLNRTAELRRLEEAERWIENQDNMESNLHSLAQVLDMRPEELSHLLTMSRDHLSLDAPMADGEDFSLGDNIEDRSIVYPDRKIEQEQLKRDIADCLEGLTVREKRVLSLRFGLNGSPVLSLQKIGSKIGLSKERIRQIEKKAIRKIRTGKCGQDLIAYL
ncbi:MAG: RNA polymerase sigma factor RpoD/SigA [Leptospirales bacterium]|nr:RNA polymerase sigma factor RpoD/SigA [Leptospirales bacterium]